MSYYLIIMELSPFVGSVKTFCTGAHKIYKNMIQTRIVPKGYVGIFSKFGNYLLISQV